MNEILQALAKMLNMTVEEVNSLLTTFKGNAPQVYELLLKEKVMYDTFRFLSNVFVVLLIFSFIGALFATIYYYTYHGEGLNHWTLGKKEVIELMEKQVEFHKKRMKPLLILSYTLLTIGLVGFVTSTVLKTTTSPNYTFVVKEILPKLTK